MEKREIELIRKFILQCRDGITDVKDREDIIPLISKYKCFNKMFCICMKEIDNKNKVYTYMLTFTMDPNKCKVSDSDLHDTIEEYIISFTDKRNAKRADLVKEGTDADHKHTHWHLGLELKKYIDFSNFLKYYRKTYGNVDISRSWSNKYDNVLKYINKSLPSIELVNIKT